MPLQKIPDRCANNVRHRHAIALRNFAQRVEHRRRYARLHACCHLVHVGHNGAQWSMGSIP